MGQAYYDMYESKLVWDRMRGHPDPPGEWSGVSFDSALVEEINQRIVEKCRKDYGNNCLVEKYV